MTRDFLCTKVCLIASKDICAYVQGMLVFIPEAPLLLVSFSVNTRPHAVNNEWVLLKTNRLYVIKF